MKTILIGAGRVGSTIAFHLARAGHDVTVVARGQRLQHLRAAQAIEMVDGRRAAVRVAGELTADEAYELAIVTVPEHQIAPLLPQLAQSRAGTVLFMFNTFQGTAPYRALVGAQRFAFGFPKMIAFLEDQRLRCRVDGPGMVTTLSDPAIAELFRQAGLPSEVEYDMDAFLRTHVALVLPTFLAALLTWRRDSALTWREAGALDAVWTEGFALVRSLGHAPRPRLAGMVAGMPSWLRAGLLWLFSRSHTIGDLGAFGPAETRHLIDTMAAMAPAHTPRTQALRP